MKNFYVKVNTGFNTSVSIPGDEAHKAYHLFLNPEKRTVFSNGVALVGKNITSIEPDYIKIMGWNEGYKLIADDYADIRDKGVDKKALSLLEKAKDIAQIIDSQNKMELLNQKLTDIPDTKQLGSDDFYSNFRLQ